MAIVFKDRVEQRTSTTGLSNLTLTGNISMRNRFQDVFSIGDELYYVIEDGNGAQWEVGKGTFTGSSTLSRDTVRANSSGTTTKITLSSNEHRVFAAPDATYLNDVVAIAASHVGVGGASQHPDATTGTSGFMSTADKTKLDGIESGATADQTGAEIKALYEAEANTNAFTDAEQTKLSSIEANATADQTGAEIKAAYEGEADTNAFTNAEKSKLAAIDQGLATNDDVTFADVDITGDLHAAGSARFESAVDVIRGVSGVSFTLGTHVNNVNDASLRIRKARGGTDTPSQIVAGDSLGLLQFQGYDGSSWNSGLALQVTSSSDTGNFGAFARLYVNGNESLRISSNSNFGFNNTSPQRTIHAATAASNSLELEFLSQNKDTTNTGGSATGYGFKISTSIGNEYIKSAVVFERTGSGGVGTLHFLNNSSGATSNASLSDSRMSIDKDGNVGVGITTPVAKLDVDGVVKFKSYTMATLPTVVSGGVINITDETGGETLAMGDSSSNWRRVTDRAIAS